MLHIHTRMKHPTFGLCYFTFVYGHPKTSKRKEVWDQPASFQEHINGPWIWIGDFNQVLSNADKQSSTSQNCPGASHLHNCLRDTEMIPLQSTGVKYTWKNKRGGDALVLEKLDKAFINNVWLHTFEHCTLEAWPIAVSDHAPLVLDINNIPIYKRRPFRFEAMWLLHPRCKQVIQQEWQKKSRIPLLISLNPNFAMSSRLASVGIKMNLEICTRNFPK